MADQLLEQFMAAAQEAKSNLPKGSALHEAIDSCVGQVGAIFGIAQENANTQEAAPSAPSMGMGVGGSSGTSDGDDDEPGNEQAT